MTSLRVGDSATIGVAGLDELIAALSADGYEVVGPVVRDAAIVPGAVSSAADLPTGWHDEHAPGSYRLRDDGDEAIFGWAVGPGSYKGELFPARESIWTGRRNGSTIEITEAVDTRAAIAIVGARPCELAGLEMLDRVLLGGAAVDGVYAGRRERAFVVVAECAAPSATCFCTSMGTGPGVLPAGTTPVTLRPGGVDVLPRFDLALTELAAGAPRSRRTAGAPEWDEGSLHGDARRAGAHRFLVTVGSERGASALGAVDHVPASTEDHDARDALIARASAGMGRLLDTDGLASLLARNAEHPRWEEVAQRCLSCGNCTTVCPTCFCTDVGDVTDLVGTLERRRRWSSCFDLDHSFLHGGPVRASAASRYRQWATHKLSTWHEQFGSSGCVGCGRCITWCPVGIDITEEVAAIRASEPGARPLATVPSAIGERAQPARSDGGSP